VDSILPKMSADLATMLGGFGPAALSADVAPVLERVQRNACPRLCDLFLNVF
jgi:hypothetical protein